ncbi:MAG TPA: hypothetical protein VKR23_15380 [Gaiellaceae bacterium]|nr:hypothetical protein [Gaiellaceae bacterium]
MDTSPSFSGEADTLEVDRLCGHHRTSDFDCGDSYYNERLTTFQERFEAGDKVLGFVVRDSRMAVHAYVIVLETVFVEEDTGRELRCFTVPAIGVDRRSRGEDLLVRRLIARSVEAMAERERSAGPLGAPYAGVICMPGDNQTLKRLLETLAFEPIGEGALYWRDRQQASPGDS